MDYRRLFSPLMSICFLNIKVNQKGKFIEENGVNNYKSEIWRKRNLLDIHKLKITPFLWTNKNSCQ